MVSLKSFFSIVIVVFQVPKCGIKQLKIVEVIIENFFFVTEWKGVSTVIAKIMLYKRNIFLWNKRESMINEATQNNSESIILENLNHFSFKKGRYFFFSWNSRSRDNCGQKISHAIPMNFQWITNFDKKGKFSYFSSSKMNINQKNCF